MPIEPLPSAARLSHWLNTLFYTVYRSDWPALVALLEREAAHTPDFFFVQIGANDGVTHDPLHELILRHRWRGVLVEPVQSYFSELQQCYRGHAQLRFERAAIASTDGARTIYRARDDAALPKWCKGLASLHAEVVLKHRWLAPRIADVLVSEPVPCLRLASLLARHDVQRIDLLAIDTEGHDFEIIQQIEFTRLRPRIILYEHKHLSRGERRDCRLLLRTQGYGLARRYGNTVAFQPHAGISAKK